MAQTAELPEPQTLDNTEILKHLQLQYSMISLDKLDA
jgi:hypothetical protein